jgi:hypothetical protein
MDDPPRYSPSTGDIGKYPGAPRWAKVIGIIVIALILLLVILKITGVGGDHGPGRHLPSGNAAVHKPSARATEGLTPSARNGHPPPERGH